MNDYIFQCMLTCIGNKRKLIPEIEKVILDIKRQLKQESISIFDGFAGSTVVSRMFMKHTCNLYTNDLEYYSYLMCHCFLKAPDNPDEIKKQIDILNDLAENGPYSPGIICENYAPKETDNIKQGERCFFTRENALIIDTLRNYISTLPKEIQVYCLVPLLIKASIHNNTAGVQKGFYTENGIGKWGGKAENCLSRIKGKIKLEVPIWKKNDVTCYNGDINDIIKDIPNVDVIYLDPPYNQHPYGSNYHILNTIASNKIDGKLSKVAGIPDNWNKSNYNYQKKANKAMQELIEAGSKKSKFILISYNNEGIINWDEILKEYNHTIHNITYDTYKGSRNLKNRNNKVIEQLILINNQ